MLSNLGSLIIFILPMASLTMVFNPKTWSFFSNISKTVSKSFIRLSHFVSFFNRLFSNSLLSISRSLNIWSHCSEVFRSKTQYLQSSQSFLHFPRSIKWSCCCWIIFSLNSSCLVVKLLVLCIFILFIQLILYLVLGLIFFLLPYIRRMANYPL